MSGSLKITHDESGRRFWTRLSGYEACLMYRREDQRIDLYHTYVPEAFRGRSVAAELCLAAFEYAKAEGLTVVPSCHYISDAFLKRHPQYMSITESGPASHPIVSG